MVPVKCSSIAINDSAPQLLSEGRGRACLKMEVSSTQKQVDFGFAFNDVVFSDRALRLEIVPSASDSNPGHHDSEFATGFEVKSLHICSVILAAKSPFFYKLFKNGMRESQQTDDVTLRINASEEAALMDLLNCMYDKPLNATSRAELVDVLMAADKFEVTYCIRHCIQLLLKLPMTTESALFYLELPSVVFLGEVVEPLIEEVKKHLAAHFKYFTKSQEEAMGLPLCAIEVVLGCDGLQVDSEDAVFDFVLKWARLHYPGLGERREILTKHLVHFICLPNMSSLKLTKVVNCPDFDCEELSNLVVQAFLSKDQVLATTTTYNFPRRVYNYRLVKVVQLDLAQPRCVVYLDLRKEECADLFLSEKLYSQAFSLGGRGFYLVAHCVQQEPNFGLYVHATEASEACTLDFEFAAMNKYVKGFTCLVKANNCTVTQYGQGFPNLFRMPWTELMSDESEYFIDGILHLQADLTIIN